MHCRPKARTDETVQIPIVTLTARVDQRIGLDGVTDVTSHEREIFAKHNDKMTRI